MPTTTTAEKKVSAEDRLVAAFRMHEGHTLNGASAVVQRHRAEAIERFEALGLPTHRLEFWKYTNVSKLFRTDFDVALDGEAPDGKALTAEDLAPLGIPDLDAHRVVLVGGRFRKDLSHVEGLPEGAVVGGFAEASSTCGELFEQHYARYATYEDRALTALNTAFARDGAFIYVPEGVVLERPVHVLHVTCAGVRPALIQPRSLLVAEAGAHVRVVEHQHVLSGNEPETESEAEVLTNAVTEIFVGERANVDHYRIQNEGARASQVQDTRVWQEAESHFRASTFTLSGKLVRNSLTVTPAAERAETHLYGLYLGRGPMHVDNHTIVEHAAPDCFSNELYKGILDEQSTGVFNGRVHVHPDAQRINAYQSNKNVVLTREAAIYSKPELEIYADDVQCSHGSTTGQLDAEALFYLRSRGIPAARARRLLLHAFARDVLETIRIEPLRAYLEALVDQRFAD